MQVVLLNQTMSIKDYVLHILMPRWLLIPNSLFHVAGTVITCPPPEPCAAEGATVMIICTRSLDLTVQSRIRVVSMDGTATDQEHYS